MLAWEETLVWVTPFLGSQGGERWVGEAGWGHVVDPEVGETSAAEASAWLGWRCWPWDPAPGQGARATWQLPLPPLPQPQWQR